MPLRASADSDAERRAVEREWESERSYSLANLTTARRGALRFVKATKTDDEWTAHSRNGLDADAFNRLKTSEEIAKQNADWYRELVGSSNGSSRSGSQAPVMVEPPIDRALVAEALHGQGSKDAPFTLEEDDEDRTDCSGFVAASDTLASAPDPIASIARVTPQATEATDGEDSAVDAEAASYGDMYCLLCKALVPSTDVPRHTSSILHQLSRNPALDGKNPLVPPTTYGIRSTNVGYGMLQRLGWAEDTGLGSTMLGRKTPIRAIEKFDRKGVGVDARKRVHAEEDEGKIGRSSKDRKPAVAKPLARNRKELESSKRREMRAFKEGLAYLNS